MGILDLKTDLGGLVSGIGSLAKDLRTAITGKEPIDATKAAELAIKAQELENKQSEMQNALWLAQIKVNEIEAQSSRWWVSGWRPFVGWICGFSLGYAAIINPFLTWLAVVNKWNSVFPELDTTITMQVLFGILGLGVYRTIDKIKAGQK